MKLSKYMCLNEGIDIRHFVPVSRITTQDKKIKNRASDNKNLMIFFFREEYQK